MQNKLILLFTIILFFYGCDPHKWERKIEENNFNLPNLKTIDTLGIRVNISEYLLYSNQYPYLSGSNLYAEKHTDVVEFVGGDNTAIFLGMVKYSPEELLELARLDSKSDSNPNDTFNIKRLHEYCVHKRIESIHENVLVSEQQPLSLRTNKKGLLQSIEEQSKIGYITRHYLIATFSYKNNYYVFYFIANAQIMPYLYDDFLAIVKSVRS